jgi:hypothetical protein
MTQFSIDRRSFFKGAGALVVSIGIPSGVATAQIGSGVKPPLSPDRLDSWLGVKADGDVVAYFTDSEILLVCDPKKVVGAPTLPPLGYNMSGCSGGPAIIHEDRGGLHLWHPVGLIVGGPKLGEGDAAEFDMIRVRRIDCIEPNGHIRRAANTGWLPP